MPLYYYNIFCYFLKYIIILWEFFIFYDKIKVHTQGGDFMNKIMNVLLHINEEERWGITCADAKNLMKMAEISNYILNIEIVANGPAVKSLAVGTLNANRVRDALNELHEKGVFVYACSNSLNAFNIDSAMVFPFVKTVPSGIFHIALRHQDNFAYIKP